MAESTSNECRGPSGQDEDFVEPVDEDFQCPICHLPLKEPVLTRCGHRYCKECLDEHIRRSPLRPKQSYNFTCPTDRHHLNAKEDVFPDKATERKILSLAIKCPSDGCKWTGELRNKKVHLDNCPFHRLPCNNSKCQEIVQRRRMEQHENEECPWRILNCSYCSDLHPECKMQDHVKECKKFPMTCPNSCGSSIPRDKVSTHTKDECPRTILSCPFARVGCRQKVQRQEMESHLESTTRVHLNFTYSRNNNTEDELKDTKAELSKTKAELSETKAELSKTKAELSETKAELSKTKAELSETKAELSETKAELSKTKAELSKTKAELSKTKAELTEKVELSMTKPELSKANVVTKVELTMTKVELSETKAELKEAVKQLKLLNVKHTNSFLWRIDGYSEIFKQAQTDKHKNDIYSDPFYTKTGTESYGYKLKVNVCPNGHDVGEKTHLSVYIFIMKGEYDAILPWPFTKKVKLTLIDQQEDTHQRQNKTGQTVGEDSENWARPMTDENGGTGFSKFISHEELNSRRFLVDDALFLQVDIE